TVAAPAAAGAAPATAVRAPAPSGASTIDRLYETLRASGGWRPLVRETRVDGNEEERVGSWATLTDAGDGRVRLKVREGSSATDAARLALELSQAGFSVVVESEAPARRSR